MKILRFLSLALLLAVSMPSAVQAGGDCCNCTYDCGAQSKCDKQNCTQCTSMYIPRSAHSNSAYFWFPAQETFDTENWHGISEIGIEYQRSFKGSDIAKCLFGTSKLHFQGSQVANRDPNALIADNFGLSTKFDGSISFKPRISNVNIHYNGRLQFDCLREGLYGEMRVTFSHQKRDLFPECCDTTTSNTGAVIPFPAGYMYTGAQAFNTSSGLSSLSVDSNSSAFPAANLKQALSGNFTFGNMQTPWAFGKFLFTDQTANKVAGVTLTLGYNFRDTECEHLNVFFQYTPPTGTLPSATYVFSPVVGNGRHNQVGAGLDAHRQLWKNDCGHSVDVYLNGYVASALPNCQVRSFDFKNKGCLSRYLLLKELNPALTTAPQYTENAAGNIINGINFATRFTNVKINVIGDASLRLLYHRDCFDFGIGYNVYGQSRESLCIVNPQSDSNNPCNVLDPNRTYGFKGCTGIVNYTYQGDVTTGTVIAGGPSEINLSNATSSTSTITQCGPTDNAVLLTTPATEVTPANQAFQVDWRSNGVLPANELPLGTPIATLVIAQSSGPAVNVTVKDLDVNSGKAPKQITQKGFVTANWTWQDCANKPYVGLGAEVEGGSRCSLKQWGLWLKAGVTF
jgi:hypothetical protein